MQRLNGGRAMWITTAVMVVILAVLPTVVHNRFYNLPGQRVSWSSGCLAMSLDVLLGYTGLLSFMHNSYLGLGAYGMGLFMIHLSGPSPSVAGHAGGHRLHRGRGHLARWAGCRCAPEDWPSRF